MEKCKVTLVHDEILKQVQKEISKDEELFELSEFFKVFGDSTRIKILQALSIDKLCVCDLAALINSSQSAVSHQLRILRNSKLVKYEKEGRVVFYTLNDNHIKKILKMGLEHIREGELK